MENKELAGFLSAIHRLKGIDLSSYRPKFLLRRLSHRINVTKSENLIGYLNLLKRDNAEFNHFLDVLAINISEFFRDSDVFDNFRKNCLREVINRKRLSNNKTIRIWSAGCAQGQEAYSLAILLREHLIEKDNFLVRIWATDVDKGALEDAEKAQYNLRNLKGMDEVRLNRYFLPLRSGLFQLDRQIRQMVKFYQHNLIKDEPFKFMDVIFCRNVMIYFSRQQQDKLLLKFYKALNSKGYLVVGAVETIWDNLSNLFIPVMRRYKIFQKAQNKKVKWAYNL